ncbi:F-box protein At3g07870-like [Papaver somniferum]|uniref:F-box protein At3g07870-like n=1 Tax=Papaver somniferum TaxID=3469 RepID=UPI000E7002BF|nr:F-box protein At3g07870-like [Papaver somniferum]
MDKPRIYRMLGSCNGLVCISMDPDRGMDKPIYICNPVTKEYLLLPSLSDTTLGSYNFFNCGIGYIPSANEYKVVKIHKCGGEVGERVYVYTLGSGKRWRYIGEITYKLMHTYRNVLVDGALHWVDYTQGNIVAFDLTEEKFSMISLTPTCFVNNWPLNRKHSSCELKVLGGSLCIVHQYNCTWYDIWSLKKGNNGNKYSHWSRDFNTFKFGCEFDYIPWANIFHVTKDDEVLFCNEYTFYNHDLKQDRDKKLECILDSVRNMVWKLGMRYFM